MRLVHGEQAEPVAANDVEKRRVIEALRGHVHDAEQSPRHVLEHPLALLGVKRAVEARGGHPELAQGHDLV